jgi:hypothetical protein
MVEPALHVACVECCVPVCDRCGRLVRAEAHLDRDTDAIVIDYVCHGERERHLVSGAHLMQARGPGALSRVLPSLVFVQPRCGYDANGSEVWS